MSRRGVCAGGPIGVAVAWVAGIACGPAVDLDSADFVAPRLVAITLPERGEVSPTPTIELVFSEPLKADSVTDESVAVVPFDLDGTCSVDLTCGDAGRCHRGRCQRERVDEGWLADMARPPISPSRRRQVAPCATALDRTGQRIFVQPQQPLEVMRLHTLLVGAGLTDRTGNPVSLQPDAVVALRHVFATGASDLARPTLTLLSPPPNSGDLPTNLARLVVAFSKPVSDLNEGSLWLAGAGGQHVNLEVERQQRFADASGSEVRVALRTVGALDPWTQWTLRVADTVVDERGQPVLDARPVQIATGDGEDTAAPRVATLTTRVSDGCVVVRARLDEPASLLLQGSWLPQTIHSPGLVDHEIALPVSLTGQLTVTAELIDLAGNSAAPAQLIVQVQPTAPVVISEVLANASGPEPEQEFVELFNRGDAPVDLAGWTLDDRDDGTGQAMIPAGILGPGQFAVAVGPGFDLAAGQDTAPHPSALLVHVGTTIGSRGLSNAGEILALRDADGTLVSWAHPYERTDASGDAGRSIERVRLHGCGLRTDWRKSPPGQSTPGQAADP